MSQVKGENHKIRYLFAGLLCTVWLIACLVVAERGLSKQSPAKWQPQTNCLNKKPAKTVFSML